MTAKELFESRMEFLMAANDRDTADKDSVYIDYILELEQDLKDSESRRKDLLTSLQSANAQKAELEQEKAELMKFVKEMNDLGKLSPMRLSDYTDVIYHGSLALLNKHTEAHNG